MATTYEAIATVTVGAGGASNIEFTSIPNTFTDLAVLFSLRNTGTGAGYINNKFSFNGSTSGYSSKLLYGDGSSAGSANNSTTSAIDYSAYASDGGTTSSTFSNGFAYIPNYAGSSNKTISIDAVSENNGTLAIAALTAGLWSNTAAITSVKITAATNNLAQYSTATLYGIKNS